MVTRLTHFNFETTPLAHPTSCLAESVISKANHFIPLSQSLNINIAWLDDDFSEVSNVLDFRGKAFLKALQGSSPPFVSIAEAYFQLFYTTG